MIRFRTFAASMLCSSLGAGCGASSSEIRSHVRQTVRGAQSSASATTRQLERSLAGGDRVVLVVNGRRWDVRERGSASVTYSKVPELDHAGPVGCPGQYFDIQTAVAVRYTAHDATVLAGGRLYHLRDPPARRNGYLVWSAHFGRGDRVDLRVGCPLPAS